MEYALLTKEYAHSAYLCEKICLDEAWSEKAIADMAENKDGVYCICLDGETVVGTAAAVCSTDEANITNVAVLPDYRRCGIARGLLKLLLDTCRGRGCERVFLEVAVTNTAAAELYRGIGFKTVGTRRRFYGNTDANIMSLTY